MKFEEIDKLKALIDTFRPLSLSQVKELERQKKLEHIWSSNAIEGNTLSKYETISFLETGLTVAGKPLKDYLEVLDLSAAFDYVQDLATENIDLELRDIRDINRIATLKTAETQSEAGQIRRIDVWPNGFPEEKYTAPYLIEAELHNFLRWHNEEAIELHPVEKAALTHFKLVSIHPFIDGNGRTSRLLMNMELIKSGYPIINIQPDVSSREAYMTALQESRNTHDATPFIQLVAEYVKEELKERISILSLDEQNIQEFNKAPRNKFEERLAQAKASIKNVEDEKLSKDNPPFKGPTL